MKNRLLVLSTLALAVSSTYATASDPSPGEFKNPAQPYLPKTWMHAMNGNLSKPGFSKDFEAMAEAGIGGAIFFHVHRRNVPLSSRGPIRFNSDEFIDTLVHAATEAEKNNVEFGIHNADGWTSSGGPWVSPENSMKRITWSEQSVRGGQTMLPAQPGFAEGLYEDVAVIALPENESSFENFLSQASITSSDPSQQTELLTDADWDSEFVFTENDSDSYWIQVAFDSARTLRSLQIETPNRHGDAALQISDDGNRFATVVEQLRRPRTGARMWAFSPQLVDDEQDAFKASYFRLVFSEPIAIKRFDLWSVPRINDWLSMNSMERGKLSLAPHIGAGAITKLDQVLVLNRGELPPQGVTLPEGFWRVLRFGYTSTGAFNVPATIEGEGLEVDKFDAEALQHHFEQYVGRLARKVKEQGIQSLKTTEIDSYEVGGQNWTNNIDRSFQDKFGYDLLPWLPAMTGRVIESPEHTGAVLQEYRQHLSELMVENYFAEFTRLSNEHGLQAYIEPYGWGPFDELAAGGQADRLMGEFWVRDELYNGRIAAAISSAHIYGKRIVSAESFTSIGDVNWRGHPYFFKHYGDEMWARGINETMFHRFAHQPNTHVKPGMTMDKIGSHIDRTQTWWHNGGAAWFDYLSRGSYLLQQGVPDADFLVHLGDVAPLRVGNANNTNVPDGFAYDYTNTDVLLNRTRVDNGWIVLPEGTRYRALHLHRTDYLHLKTIKRIEELVADGATVIGKKPVRVIGYSEWPQQQEFERIADALWGNGQKPVIRSYKKGIVSSHSLDDTIKELGYQPDLIIDGKAAKFFAQRRIGDNDLYYFYNDKPEFQRLTVDFRDGDGQPEIWNVDDGGIEEIHDYRRDGKRLISEFALEPYGVRFVLIRRDGKRPSYDGTHSQLIEDIYQETSSSSRQIQELRGPWSVDFDPDLSGPGNTTFSHLLDWTDSPVSGIRLYSGTAVYRKTFTVTETPLDENKRIYVDLGEVQQIAELSINGRQLATLWKPPFAFDISKSLKVGENTLEVAITNTWVNRLIGDQNLPDTSGYSMTGNTVAWLNNDEPPPPSERVTFTGYNFYEDEKDRILQSSGLLGPVRLITLVRRPPPYLKQSDNQEHIGPNRDTVPEPVATRNTLVH